MYEACIKVWAWDDAPPEFRELSEHGGDEDWVVLLPPKHAGQWLQWMDENTAFGGYDFSSHTHPDFPGCEIRIWAHA